MAGVQGSGRDLGEDREVLRALRRLRSEERTPREDRHRDDPCPRRQHAHEGHGGRDARGHGQGRGRMAQAQEAGRHQGCRRRQDDGPDGRREGHARKEDARRGPPGQDGRGARPRGGGRQGSHQGPQGPSGDDRREDRRREERSAHSGGQGGRGFRHRAQAADH